MKEIQENGRNQEIKIQKTPQKKSEIATTQSIKEEKPSKPKNQKPNQFCVANLQIGKETEKGRSK